MKNKLNSRLYLMAICLGLVITASTYLITPQGTKYYEWIGESHNETAHGYPLSYLTATNNTHGSALNFAPSTGYRTSWPSLLVDVLLYSGFSLAVIWAYLGTHKNK